MKRAIKIGLAVGIIVGFAVWIIPQWLSVHACSASVETVSQSTQAFSSRPSGTNPNLYFDASNQLHLAFEKAPSMIPIAPVSGVCAEGYFTINSPMSQSEVLGDPKVIVQICTPANATGYAKTYGQHYYLVGVDSMGGMRWSKILNVNGSPVFQIVGIFKDGFVLAGYVRNRAALEIISPETGAVLYQVDMPIDRGSAVVTSTYDSAHHVVYLATYNYVSGPGKLYKMDLQSGVLTQLAEMPRQFITRMPASAHTLVLTSAGRYLLMTADFSSRLTSPYDIFSIYDLKKNRWICQKSFGFGSMLVLGQGDDIGLVSLEGSIYRVIHLRIKSSPP